MSKDLVKRTELGQVLGLCGSIGRKGRALWVEGKEGDRTRLGRMVAS